MTARTPEEYLRQLKAEQERIRKAGRINRMRKKLQALGYDTSKPGPVKGIGGRMEDFGHKRKLVPGRLRPITTPQGYLEKQKAEHELQKLDAKRARIRREREARALELRAQNPTPSGVKGT